jgi:hypothetical protein
MAERGGRKEREIRSDEGTGGQGGVWQSGRAHLKTAEGKADGSGQVSAGKGEARKKERRGARRERLPICAAPLFIAAAPQVGRRLLCSD